MVQLRSILIFEKMKPTAWGVGGCLTWNQQVGFGEIQPVYEFFIQRLFLGFILDNKTALNPVDSWCLLDLMFYWGVD